MKNRYDNNLVSEQRNLENERTANERNARDKNMENDSIRSDNNNNNDNDNDKDKVLVGIFETENEVIDVIRRLKETGYEHQLIEVESSIIPDPALADIIERELTPFKDKLNAVVGETATALNRYTMLESTMDNFLLQSLMETSGAELAFSNGWRYGAPVIPGPVKLNDLYNIIPMDPPIGTVELTGDQLVSMLEENLERTFASNAYDQMGGYIKRGLGLTVYLKIENPAGQRIQQVFIGKEPLVRSHTYHTAFVTEQGVPRKFGSQRSEMNVHAVEAMQAYLAKHNPMNAELRGTYIPV